MNQNLTPRKLLFLLLFSVVAVYAPMLSYGFIDFDLTPYLSSNSMVLQGLTSEGLWWAFNSLHFNWHPLTWLSHMLDVELFALNPLGHNLTSLLIHCLNSILVYSIFVRLRLGIGVAFFLAFFFAIHPLHVGPVVWLAARKDLLAAAFGFLSILAYLNYLKFKNTQTLIVSIFLFALSLMSKSSFIILPLLLLLLDYWPLKRFSDYYEWKAPMAKESNPSRAGYLYIFIEKTPYFILSALSLLMAFWAQYKVGAVRSIEQFPLFWRIENVCISYVAYIQNAFWPFNLAIFYPAEPEINPAYFIGSLLGLLLITYATLKFNKKAPYLSLGWFWFIISFLPMIGFVQLGEQAMADRYTYVPYVGLFLMLVCSVRALLLSQPTFKKYLIVASTLFTIYITAATVLHLAKWKDSETIYRYTLENTKNNYIIHNNLGGVLAAKQQHLQAIEQYRACLEISPGNFKTHKNMGDSYFALRDYDQALTSYQALLKNDPSDIKVLNNVGVIFLIQKDYPRAREYFSKVLSLDPDYSLARKNMERLAVKEGAGADIE